MNKRHSASNADTNFDKMPVSLSIPSVNHFVLLLEIHYRYRNISSPQEFRTIPNKLLCWEQTIFLAGFQPSTLADLSEMHVNSVFTEKCKESLHSALSATI